MTADFKKYNNAAAFRRALEDRLLVSLVKMIQRIVLMIDSFYIVEKRNIIKLYIFSGG